MRQYFVNRPGPSVASMGEQYWRKKPDPDGRVRDMTSRRERRKKLGLMSDELATLKREHVGGGARVLDVGCGVGWTLQALQAQGWLADGVEPDEWACAQAVKLCDPASRGAVVYPDVELLREYHYDAALCYHVIEHVHDPVPFAEQLVRCVKPGGLLVVGSPDFDSHGARQYRKRFRLLADPTHVSLFTTRSLCALLEDYGCCIERVHYPEPPKPAKGKQTRRVGPPMLGNIVTVYARRGSQADEAAAAEQRKAWAVRAGSDLLGSARSLV